MRCLVHFPISAMTKLIMQLIVLVDIVYRYYCLKVRQIKLIFALIRYRETLIRYFGQATPHILLLWFFEWISLVINLIGTCLLICIEQLPIGWLLSYRTFLRDVDFRFSHQILTVKAVLLIRYPLLTAPIQIFLLVHNQPEGHLPVVFKKLSYINSWGGDEHTKHPRYRWWRLWGLVTGLRFFGYSEHQEKRFWCFATETPLPHEIPRSAFTNSFDPHFQYHPSKNSVK